MAVLGGESLSVRRTPLLLLDLRLSVVNCVRLGDPFTGESLQENFHPTMESKDKVLHISHVMSSTAAPSPKVIQMKKNSEY